MLNDKTLKIVAVLVAIGIIGLFTGCAVAGDAGKDKASKVDYTSMNAKELADYLILEKSGFRLDTKTQEGGTARDRLMQDETQKACSAIGKGSVDGDTASKVSSMARESIKLPQGGVKLGDWSKGEAVARSGYGFRVGHKNDDHSKRDPGGNCYACHALDPKEIAYGTLGPSLTGYGKLRGNSEAIQKYTYEVIYNAHAYFPCTAMPRFGHNGVLTEAQIADVMAYLLDPESPVNK